MSTQINDGGPAFPWEDMKDTTGQSSASSGMSLRDYFAGQALAGLMTNPELQLEVVKAQIVKPGREKLTIGGCLAYHCFDLANAMLEARNNPSPPTK